MDRPVRTDRSDDSSDDSQNDITGLNEPQTLLQDSETNIHTQQ